MILMRSHCPILREDYKHLKRDKYLLMSLSNNYDRNTEVPRETWKESRQMQREDGPNTRPLSSKNRIESELRNSTADIRLQTPPPFLLSYSLFLHSYVIPDPQWPLTFPKQLDYIQTYQMHIQACFFRTLHPWVTELRAFLRLSPASSWYNTTEGIPLSMVQLCGCMGHVWIIWLCPFLPLEQKRHQALYTIRSRKNIFRGVWRLKTAGCVFPPVMRWGQSHDTS